MTLSAKTRPLRKVKSCESLSKSNGVACLGGILVWACFCGEVEVNDLGRGKEKKEAFKLLLKLKFLASGMASEPKIRGERLNEDRSQAN